MLLSVYHRLLFSESPIISFLFISLNIFLSFNQFLIWSDGPPFFHLGFLIFPFFLTSLCSLIRKFTGLQSSMTDIFLTTFTFGFCFCFHLPLYNFRFDQSTHLNKLFYYYTPLLTPELVESDFPGLDPDKSARPRFWSILHKLHMRSCSIYLLVIGTHIHILKNNQH